MSRSPSLRLALIGLEGQQRRFEGVSHLVEPGVVDARAPRTMHLGPDVVHVDLDLWVTPPSAGVETSRRIEAAVREKHPQVHRVSFRFPE